MACSTVSKKSSRASAPLHEPTATPSFGGRADAETWARWASFVLDEVIDEQLATLHPASRCAPRR